MKRSNRKSNKSPFKIARQIRRADKVAAQAMKHNQRNEILLACLANVTPASLGITERAYFDEHRLYKTCDPPVPGDDDYAPQQDSLAFIANRGNVKDTQASSLLSSFPSSSYSSPLPSKSILSTFPREDPDFGPIDSGCNLPVTNPKTVLPSLRPQPLHSYGQFHAGFASPTANVNAALISQTSDPLLVA